MAFLDLESEDSTDWTDSESGHLRALYLIQPCLDLSPSIQRGQHMVLNDGKIMGIGRVDHLVMVLVVGAPR